MKAGRAIKRIVPDGNCFFRAVAFYLFQDESKHYFVRAQIVEFERVNEKQFTKFLISPVNKPTFVYSNLCHGQHKLKSLL